MGNLFTVDIVAEAKRLFGGLASLSVADKIDAINQIKLALREHSPMASEPVDCVIWVESEHVVANDYNPNTVAPPEMELLKTSIIADGYTQPVVVMRNSDSYEVVDGFHRTRCVKEVGAIKKRVHGCVPVAVINTERTDKADRIAATVRHNRARGKHGVDAMSDLVADLARRNWSDAKISKELGMEPDEVLRLKQVTGLAELFANEDFSRAWEAETPKRSL